jgi:lysophospholipase L1-like esterase
LWRLQTALRDAAPPTVSTSPITVTQGPTNSADPSIGADAAIYPTPRGPAVNPNPDSLATIPEVWGHSRQTWSALPAGFVGSAGGNGGWFVPIARWHRAATYSAFSTAGVHFVFDGSAFEVLFLGTSLQVTLIADNELMTAEQITTTIVNGVPGAPLSGVNSYVRFDFGARPSRNISLYASSSQGPATIAIDKRDSLAPWDRADEPSFCAMTDSYGQGDSVNWGLGGPFWEAATLLGIPHLDLNAMGGTGYAPNNAGADVRNPGNAFVARIPAAASSVPDLLLTAGGINDNNWLAAPPLYASGAEAKSGFDVAVFAYFAGLRAALPQSVLVAMGPWAPVESRPVDAIAQSKADTVLAALRAVAGPWIFLDNLNGGWTNSASKSQPPVGRGWQTGTGRVGSPKGDGNGDLYVAADGVHPTPAGCVYLGRVIATELRAALLAL